MQLAHTHTHKHRAKLDMVVTGSVVRLTLYRRGQRGRPTKVPRVLQCLGYWSNGDESAWVQHEHRSG
eukprot:4667039-Amphidinium_carterae.1